MTPSNEGTIRYLTSADPDNPADGILFTGTVPGNGQIDIDLALVSVRLYCCGLILTTAEGVSKTATVQLADIDGVPRANLTNLVWAWYDQVPQTGVFPTDFDSNGTTDADGFLTVDISKSTLDVGQTGYLGAYDIANGWAGFYAVVVA